MKKSVIIRAAPELKSMFREINVDRVKQGKSKNFLSDRRLSLAITRIPLLKKTLIDSEIKDE